MVPKEYLALALVLAIKYICNTYYLSQHPGHPRMVNLELYVM